jgi:hypothetical protein
VVSIRDQVFLAHHSGSGVEQWAVSPHAVRSAQIDYPQLLETAFGTSLEVNYVPHEAMRFGVVLRDKWVVLPVFFVEKLPLFWLISLDRSRFGNQLSDPRVLSSVVGKVRKVMALNESVDVLDLKFAPSKTDVISLTAHMPAVDDAASNKTAEAGEVMKLWNCRVSSLLDMGSVVSSTTSAFAPVFHDVISEAFVVEGRISRRGRYLLFFAKESEIRKGERKGQTQSYAYSPTSLRQLSKSVTTGARERPNKPLDGLPLTRMSWIYPTFALNAVPGLPVVRLCSLCAVPPHALLDFIGKTFSCKFLRWLSISCDGVLTMSPHSVVPQRVDGLGSPQSAKLKVGDQPAVSVPPSQLQSLTSVHLQVLDSEIVMRIASSSDTVPVPEAATLTRVDSPKSRASNRRKSTRTTPSNALRPLVSPIRAPKQSPLRRVGSASFHRTSSGAAAVDKPIVRLPSGWFVIPQPTAEEMAAEKARKLAETNAHRDKRKALRHASVDVVEKSTWSGNPTIVLASIDDVFSDRPPFEHGSETDDLRQPLPAASDSETCIDVDPSPGVLEGSSGGDAGNTFSLGEGELLAGAVCVVFLQLIDHKGNPTPAGNVSCSVSLQSGHATPHAAWQAGGPPSTLAAHQYELHWFRIPESCLTPPPPSHLVGMIRSYRRMTGPCSENQPDRTSSVEPSSVYCVVLTTKSPVSCLLSLLVDGTNVAHSPVRLTFRPEFPLAILTIIADDSGLSCCDAEAQVISDDLLAQLDVPTFRLPSSDRTCPFVRSGIWRHATFVSADVWGNPTCVALTAVLQRLEDVDETWTADVLVETRHRHQVYRLASDGISQPVKRTVEQALVDCWDASAVYNSKQEDVIEKQECCHWLPVTSDEGRVEIEQDSSALDTWNVKFCMVTPGRYRLVVRFVAFPLFSWMLTCEPYSPCMSGYTNKSAY